MTERSVRWHEAGGGWGGRVPLSWPLPYAGRGTMTVSFG